MEGLAETLLRSYLYVTRGYGHDPDFDSFIKHPVPAIEIISEEDERFESLTGYSTWSIR